MTWTNLDNATLYRVRKLRKTAEALGLRLGRNTNDPAEQEFASDVLDDKSKDILVLMCSLDVAEAAILAERADRHLKAYEADMTRVNALGGVGTEVLARRPGTSKHHRRSDVPRGRIKDAGASVPRDTVTPPSPIATASPSPSERL